MSSYSGRRQGLRRRQGGGGPHSAGPAAADQPHPHPGGVHRGLGQQRGQGQRQSAAQLRPGGFRDGQVSRIIFPQCEVWSVRERERAVQCEVMCVYIRCYCFLLAPPPPTTLIFSS